MALIHFNIPTELFCLHTSSVSMGEMNDNLNNDHRVAKEIKDKGEVRSVGTEQGSDVETMLNRQVV